MRREIEDTLALWREAERQLDSIREGEGESPAAIAREREVIRLRARFRDLTATCMLGRLDGLHETETREPDSISPNPTMRGDRVHAISAEVWGSFDGSTMKQ